MSNWFTRGLTDKRVGFGQDGSDCEGGACSHLSNGDKAHGYTAENDSFGSEMYLLCRLCYNEHLEARKTELVSCDDCKGEFPRNETISHIPYFVDELPAEKWKKIVCVECQALPRHLRRLEVDEEERSHDQDAQDDWFDAHGPDDEPDHEEPVPDDEFETFEEPAPVVVYDRVVDVVCQTSHYSGAIQKITITPRP